MYLLQAASVQSMHEVLANLYNEMMPLCSKLIGVSQLIAAFGALLFIAYRVWKHIANAEPIDFFPLLRPFALSIAIGIFPGVLGVINGVLNPTVVVTQSMVTETNADVQRLLQARSLASGGDDTPLFLANPDNKEDGDGGVWNAIFTLNFTQLFKLFIATVLELLYYAASLCIDCMRTFHLIILGVLGPLVFALSVYDGFQHTLAIWFGRYINIFLWLPIANLFGALIGRLQASMLRLDLTQIQDGQEGAFSQTDAAYIIFMIIGIVGYLTIPSVANHIVHASGGGALMNKVNTIIASRINISRFGGSSSSSSTVANNSSVGFKKAASEAASFMRSKIAGK